jgi:RNA polymerase sigma-70 factor (ECF subfamily)
MDAGHTTAAVQSYLNELAGIQGDQPAEPIVRELLAGSARRLHMVCASLLHKSYPRLERHPLGLRSEEVLSAVVERLLKALREARPQTVAQFFALANQHMRWELNDLARTLDRQPLTVGLEEVFVAAPESSELGLSGIACRILDSIDQLPEAERETFTLVRIQGLMHTEVAEIHGVSTKTVQRRLTRALVILTESLGDLAPREDLPGDA